MRALNARLPLVDRHEPERGARQQQPRGRMRHSSRGPAPRDPFRSRLPLPLAGLDSDLRREPPDQVDVEEGMQPGQLGNGGILRQAQERVLPPSGLVGRDDARVLPHARRLSEILQRGTAEGEAELDEPDAVPQKPRAGRVMMLCAVIGGPFATICYVIGLNSATASGNPGVIVPIAALNCAIGAVLGRILFKQELKAHKVVVILVCLASASMTGSKLRDHGPRRSFGMCVRVLGRVWLGFRGMRRQLRNHLDRLPNRHCHPSSHRRLAGAADRVPRSRDYGRRYWKRS